MNNQIVFVIRARARARLMEQALEQRQF